MDERIACAVIAGPPSAGKSAVIRALAPHLAAGGSIGYIKTDVVATREAAAFARLGWRSAAIVSEDTCPDHALFERLPETLAKLGPVDLLLLETAGLCGRCAPYLDDAVALVVIEATAGLDAPARLGPLFDAADLCVLTHGDRLSQAEREILEARVVAGRDDGGRAPALFWVDGLTREGAPQLARALHERLAGVAGMRRGGDDLQARQAPPRLRCTLCLGRTDLPLPAHPEVTPC